MGARGLTTIIVPLLGGLLAGMVAMKVAEHRRRPGLRDLASDRQREQSQNAEPDGRAAERSRADDLANRLSALERAGAGTNVNRGGDTESPEAREERFKKIRAAFQTAIDRHKAAVRHQWWAEPMEGKIGSLLKTPAAHMSFKYKGVDCRTNTCVATVEWPSPGMAKAELRRMVALLGPAGCSPTILVPPEVGDRAVEAPVMLRCGEANQ
jgi:hypothetical protein